MLELANFGRYCILWLYEAILSKSKLAAPLDDPLTTFMDESNLTLEDLRPT